MDVTINVQSPNGEKDVLCGYSVKCKCICKHKLPSVTVLVYTHYRCKNILPRHYRCEYAARILRM